MTKAQVVKVGSYDRKHVRVSIVCDDGSRVSFVRGGKRLAYLRIGDTDGLMLDTISGEKALRALARAILAELRKD